MGYLLDWGIRSFLSVQGHGKTISTLPSELSFGSWEQRCICVSIVKILMRDRTIWSAGRVSAQWRRIIRAPIQSADNANTVDVWNSATKKLIHTKSCNIICSYLTSLLLPENRRLRVSFGFTWERGSAALGHNLVPWTDDKLWCSWRTGKRHQCE